MTSSTSHVTITRRPSEATVRHLLEGSKLPTVDLTTDKLQSFYALEQDGEVRGIVGLELYETVGLLRSLVVTPEARNHGIGSALVAHAERLAADRGVTLLYLLTEAAEPFFRRRGFERAERERAPEAIRQTSEFAGLCPTSAAFMVKRLLHSRLP